MAQASQHESVSDSPVIVSTTTTTTTTTTTKSPKAQPRLPRRSIHEIYKQPAPLRVFPFPTLTSNPVSWLHLAVAWVGQVFSPPPSEPSFIHTAYWDVATRSIMVTDDKSMADLWQQGFYGKGNFSRSEPNWLKREHIRQGIAKGRVSEVNTDQRREDRTRVKWERARAEQEALEQRRLNETSLLVGAQAAAVIAPLTVPATLVLDAPVGPLELLALPNSHFDLVARTQHYGSRSEDSTYATDVSVDESGSFGNDEADSNTTVSSDSTELKRRKSVRFSPDVESTVFSITDPPSPPRSESPSSLLSRPALAATASTLAGEQSLHNTLDQSLRPVAAAVTSIQTVVNKEHLQLAHEEAFFLVFALGALKVVDTVTEAVIPTADLFTLLRQHSYFPPRISQPPQPDDPFLIHYAVYHHFRSLGWVPRPGLKFGVDWMLYNRGPVFDHAEYGLQVLPSYSHPYWKDEGRQTRRKSWHWLMGVNRVLSKVFKSLVVVDVDIPPPTACSGDQGTGVADILKQYRIRETMVKRWSSNRNRDIK